MYEAEKKANEYTNKALELYNIHADYTNEVNRIYKQYKINVDL